MAIKESDTAIKILTFSVPFLEKLGVCVATFVGGGAIAKYSAVIFECFPWGPWAVGWVLIIGALVLAILVVYEAWRQLTASIAREWVSVLVLLLLLVPSVFFVLAGGLAAIKALPAP